MSDDSIALELFYPYGYQGRSMMAVRAPSALLGDGTGLVGKIARIDGARYRIVAVSRQISGPVAAGEPIGVEVRPYPEATGA